MSADDITHHVGDDCPGGHRDEVAPPIQFARGDVLLVTNLTELSNPDGDALALRVLDVEDYGDGVCLLLAPYAGEEPTDG